MLPLSLTQPPPFEIIQITRPAINNDDTPTVADYTPQDEPEPVYKSYGELWRAFQSRADSKTIYLGM